MKGALVLFSVVLLPSLFLIGQTRVDASQFPPLHSKTKSYIVFTLEPPGQGPEADAYFIKILAAVLGSEKAAKDALIYTYPHISGFAARLTRDQVAKLKKQPEVVSVLPPNMIGVPGP